jgi:ribosome biogenesis GTPase
MSKRKHTRPQRPYDKIQKDRLAREEKKAARAEQLLATSEPGPRQSGQVVAHYGANLEVEDQQGRLHHCLTRRNLPRLVCGDQVIWQATGENTGIIVEQQPRRTLLSRPDYNVQLKPVAANIDQILVVTACRPGFDEDLINRYLIAAYLTQITPVIVVNKVDLLGEKELQQLQMHMDIYTELDYKVIYASTQQRHGLDELYQQVHDRTSIFAGQSGVGKSSLIKTLIPDLDIRIGELSHATGLGKHTTTVTVLYRLHDGGSIIDSPGVREFGLGHVSQQRIAQGFIEFQPFIERCKFNDCTHEAEPDCAVRQGVEQGELSRQRYESYLRIVKSLGRP